MQQSMTGYGQDERQGHKFLIKSEIKSLNSKFLDFTTRYGKEFASREIEIRNLISDKLKRGKVIFSIELTSMDEANPGIHVDEVLFKAYFNKFSALASDVGSSTNDVLKISLEAPDVIRQQELSHGQMPWEEIFAGITAAADQCISFRKEEGLALEKKLQEYVTDITECLKEVESADKSRADNIRARVQKNMDDIRDKVQVDENRFEQELIHYLERMDISEERVRLKQHLSYFMDVIVKEEFAGKKLGFIAQEIGREINTIGSKANDAEIQRVAVRMKDDLEKIKEQVLNIL